MVAARDLYAALDSLRSLYPGGIPLEILSGVCAETKTPKGQTQRTGILSLGTGGNGISFVLANAQKPEDFLRSPDGQLLDAAVSKGLQQTLGECCIVFNPNPEVWDLLASKHVKIALVLGTQAAADSGLKEVLGSQGQKKGVSIIVSHELSAVAADPAVKKAFWEHLKTAGQLAKGDNLKC